MASKLLAIHATAAHNLQDYESCYRSFNWQLEKANLPACPSIKD